MSEDKLDTIFKLQGELDRMVKFTDMYYEDQVNNNFMATIHELCELHDETNWKKWKKTKKKESREKKLEEFADIIHFVIQTALMYGFDSEEVYSAYLNKNIINRERVRDSY